MILHTIVIPTLNEEAEIGGCLIRLQGLREEGFEGGVFVSIALVAIEKIAHFFSPYESGLDLVLQIIVQIHWFK